MHKQLETGCTSLENEFTKGQKRQVDSLMLMPPDGAERRAQPRPWHVLHMYVSDFRGQLNKPSVFLKTSLSQDNSEDIYTKKGSWNHFLSAGPLAPYFIMTLPYYFF